MTFELLIAYLIGSVVIYQHHGAAASRKFLWTGGILVLIFCVVLLSYIGLYELGVVQ